MLLSSSLLEHNLCTYLIQKRAESKDYLANPNAGKTKQSNSLPGNTTSRISKWYPDQFVDIITNSQETACMVTADSLFRKHSKVKSQQAGALEAEQKDVCELQAIPVCPGSKQ